MINEVNISLKRSVIKYCITSIHLLMPFALNLTKIKIIFPRSLAVGRCSVDGIQCFLFHLRYRVAVEYLDWNIFCVWIHSANEDRLLRY